MSTWWFVWSAMARRYWADLHFYQLQAFDSRRNGGGQKHGLQHQWTVKPRPPLTPHVFKSIKENIGFIWNWVLMLQFYCSSGAFDINSIFDLVSVATCLQSCCFGFCGIIFLKFSCSFHADMGFLPMGTHDNTVTWLDISNIRAAVILIRLSYHLTTQFLFGIHTICWSCNSLTSFFRVHKGVNLQGYDRFDRYCDETNVFFW